MRRGRHFERKSEHPALRWMKNNPIKTVTGTLAVTAAGAGVVAVRNRTRVDSNSLGNGNEQQLFTPTTKQSSAIALSVMQNESVTNFLDEVNKSILLKTVQDRDDNDDNADNDAELIENEERTLVKIYEKHCAPSRKPPYFTQWIGIEKHVSSMLDVSKPTALDVSKPTVVSLRDDESCHKLSQRIDDLKLQHVGIVCARPYDGDSKDLLSGCHNLISAHFIMPYVTEVGDNWLNECGDSLTYVTLAGMSSLTQVGDLWMSWNPKLVSVDFKGLDRLKTVGSKWLEDCESIIDIRFEGLHALVEVGNDWMRDCMSLRSVEFHGLDSLEKVGDGWLEDCKSIRDIRFEGLRALVEVGNRWMKQCGSLPSVKFHGLDSLEKVGDGWLKDCKSIRDIRFEGLRALVEVGNSWTKQCRNLTSPKFVGLPKLRKVGTHWLYNCRRLEHPNFEQLHSLECVGDKWMRYASHRHTASNNKPEFGKRLKECVEQKNYTFVRTGRTVTAREYAMKECAVETASV